MAMLKAQPTMKEEDRWRARDDLRTLITAEEIKADKKRYAAAIKEGKAQQKELQNVMTEQEEEGAESGEE